MFRNKFLTRDIRLFYWA